MKKKNIFAILALSLTVSVAAGCSNSSSIAFTSNWYSGRESGILAGTETCTYNVAIKADSASNKTYSMICKNASFVTTLAADPQTELYTYTTTLTMDVQYVFDGQTSPLVTNQTTTVVTFRSALQGLRPVSMTKNVYATSPAGISPKNLQDCYAVYRYTEEITYNDTCTRGKHVRTDLAGENENKVGNLEKNFSISNKQSYLDHAQIACALRAINSSSSQTALAYNTAQRTVQTLTIAKEDTVTLSLNFNFNSTPMTSMKCIPVTLAISAQNSGGTQTYFIAKSSEDSNKNRSVIMQMEIPISYNLGTLLYTLTDVTTF